MLQMSLSAYVEQSMQMLNTRYNVLSDQYAEEAERLTRYYLSLRECGYTNHTMIQIADDALMQYETIVDPAKYVEPKCLGINEDQDEWSDFVVRTDWLDFIEKIGPSQFYD